MVIGILQVELYISCNQSLKGKRIVLKSLKDRIRNNFNVSISELDDQDKWQRTKLGIAIIGTEKRGLDAVLANLVEFIRGERCVELLNHQIELL